jgi:hypothetical protein
MIKLKTIKSLTKKPRKTIRKEKEEGSIEIIIIIIEKIKIINLKDKIESQKNFNKKKN